MERFTHYGEEIIHQFNNGEMDYRTWLASEGVQYIDLPIRDDVISFYSPNFHKKKYAYMTAHSIYLMDSIPDDLKFSLIEEDFLMQQQGHAPMVMQTKLMQVFAKAKAMAEQELNGKLGADESLEGALEKEYPQEEYYYLIRRYFGMISGQSPMWMAGADKTGVDELFWKVFPEMMTA